MASTAQNSSGTPAESTTEEDNVVRRPFESLLARVAPHAERRKKDAADATALKQKLDKGITLTGAEKFRATLSEGLNREANIDIQYLNIIRKMTKQYEEGYKVAEEKRYEKTVEIIGKFLLAKDYFMHMRRPEVRKHFEDGSKGAAKLSKEQFAIFDELSTMFCMSSEGFESSEEFSKFLLVPSRELTDILRGKSKGTPRFEVLQLIVTSDYFKNHNQHPRRKENGKQMDINSSAPPVPPENVWTKRAEELERKRNGVENHKENEKKEGDKEEKGGEHEGGVKKNGVNAEDRLSSDEPAKASTMNSEATVFVPRSSSSSLSIHGSNLSLNNRETPTESPVPDIPYEHSLMGQPGLMGVPQYMTPMDPVAQFGVMNTMNQLGHAYNPYMSYGIGGPVMGLGQMGSYSSLLQQSQFGLMVPMGQMSMLNQFGGIGGMGYSQPQIMPQMGQSGQSGFPVPPPQPRQEPQAQQSNSHTQDVRHKKNQSVNLDDNASNGQKAPSEGAGRGGGNGGGQPRPPQGSIGRGASTSQRGGGQKNYGRNNYNYNYHHGGFAQPQMNNMVSAFGVHNGFYPNNGFYSRPPPPTANGGFKNVPYVPQPVPAPAPPPRPSTSSNNAGGSQNGPHTGPATPAKAPAKKSNQRQNPPPSN